MQQEQTRRPRRFARPAPRWPHWPHDGRRRARGTISTWRASAASARPPRRAPPPVVLLLGPGIPAGVFAGDRDHRDAVDGAGRHAQVATGAELGHHRVHLFRSPDDRVDRAGLDAQRAADAELLVDHGQRPRALLAMLDGQRDHRLAEQIGEPLDAFVAAGRALVVVGAAVGDCLGIRTAAIEAALRALCLGQQIFDAIREFSGVGHGDGGAGRAPGRGGSARPEWFGKAQLSPISRLALGCACAHNQGAFFARPQQVPPPTRPVGAPGAGGV